MKNISAQTTEPKDFLRDYIKIEVVEVVGRITEAENYKTTGKYIELKNFPLGCPLTQTTKPHQICTDTILKGQI